MRKRHSWYLPNFPVFNLNKPTKLRIVWDAAARVGGVSLNSFLFKGPDLVMPLLQVRYRLHEHKIAVSADVDGWLSNCQMVVDVMGEQRTRQKNLNQTAPIATEKALGMWWDTINDTFMFKIPNQCRQDLLSGKKAPTNREVLRILMSVYDPLGFLANVLMYLKVRLQEAWRSKIALDEPITEELVDSVAVDSVAFPRCYRKLTSSLTETNEIQLHVFVDASETGYAAVAYLYYEENGCIECTFVTAKTRVGPVKYVSIPRLELQAAVIGMRLAKYIRETHQICVRKRFFCSGSRDVLCCLSSDHRKCSKCVAPKVGEIPENSDMSVMDQPLSSRSYQ